MAARRRSLKPGEIGETTERVLDALDPDAADVILSFVTEPLVAPEVLAEQTRLYFKEVEAMADDGEAIDLELVTDLAVQCERLLDEMDDDMPEEHQRLIEAAVRYFVDNEDSDRDLDSLLGFDDDISVIETVAIAVGKEHVLERGDD